MRSRTYLFFALLLALLVVVGTQPFTRNLLPTVQKAHATNVSILLIGFITGWNASTTKKPDHNCAPGRRGRLGPEKRRRGPHTSSCSMVITTALPTRPTVRRWTHAQPPSRPQP